MKVLVIGSGAREHALVWKLSQSKRISKIFTAPGNGGTQKISENINISPEDGKTLLAFAQKEKIDLTVVGPETPLVNGIVDLFMGAGLKIFGPDKKGALLEGSKMFAKDFMSKYDIPTGKYMAFDEYNEAIDNLKSFDFPLVIKADGLASGKGVVICINIEEAYEAIGNMMKNFEYGEAGRRIIIEEYLEGMEASVLCFVDGKKIIPMEGARDYKKAFNGDEGPNTGGMGCFSPNPILTEEVMCEVKKNIIDKTMDGLNKEKINFKGVLFIGIMITHDGPKVLEYNVRMGDPETEAIIPRLESDIVDILEKTIEGNLKPQHLKWNSRTAVTVVATSKGYPDSYEKGKKIDGLKDIDKDVLVFHGGTKYLDDNLCTNGGRVLAVTALGDSLEDARRKAYENIRRVNFEGAQYRDDIGII